MTGSVTTAGIGSIVEEAKAAVCEAPSWAVLDVVSATLPVSVAWAASTRELTSAAADDATAGSVRDGTKLVLMVPPTPTAGTPPSSLPFEVGTAKGSMLDTVPSCRLSRVNV